MNRKLSLAVFILFLGVLVVSGCTTHNAAMTFHSESLESEPPGLEHLHAIVVFDSWSGNTRAIAEEIACVLQCPAIPVDEANNYGISDCDLLVVGSPVHGGMPTSKIDDFLSQLEPMKASAVFVTYGAPLFGTLTADSCLSSMEDKLHNTSLGRFKCNGFHHILRTYPRHPDEEDKSEAAKFAAGLLKRLSLENLQDNGLMVQ